MRKTISAGIEKDKILKELQIIPGVGKSIADELYNIGIKKVDDLKGKRPKTLYKKLNRYSGVKNDICLLYTFRCAVYYATESNHKKEKLNWWYWKNRVYID
ncbi:MAG: helix-hairpin-helix domain-containing protein [Ignavibacteriaceae bacterium]